MAKAIEGHCVSIVCCCFSRPILKLFLRPANTVRSGSESSTCYRSNRFSLVKLHMTWYDIDSQTRRPQNCHHLTRYVGGLDLTVISFMQFRLISHPLKCMQIIPFHVPQPILQTSPSRYKRTKLSSTLLPYTNAPASLCSKSFCHSPLSSPEATASVGVACSHYEWKNIQFVLLYFCRELTLIW